MKRVATAAVLIPVVLIAVLRAPIPVLAALVALVAVLTTHEFLQVCERYGVQPLRPATYVYVIIPFLLLALEFGRKPLLATGAALYTGLTMAVVAPFIFLALAMVRQELSSGLPAAASALFAFAYIAMPLALLVQLRQHWAGAYMLLYLLVVVWVGDTAAYYVGRAYGRHLMAPRISPKKTWEGAAASFVASIAVGWLILSNGLAISTALFNVGLIERSQGYFALRPPAMGASLALSAALNVAAQIGDLVESLLKRGAGVKDSGAILPGHGGMLDRIDALLFAAPVLWYYAAWRVMS